MEKVIAMIFIYLLVMCQNLKMKFAFDMNDFETWSLTNKLNGFDLKMSFYNFF